MSAVKSPGLYQGFFLIFNWINPALFHFPFSFLHICRYVPGKLVGRRIFAKGACRIVSRLQVGFDSEVYPIVFALGQCGSLLKINCTICRRVVYFG